MVRVPNSNPRMIRAKAEAKQQTDAFFRANPTRQHWVRLTLPHELDNLGRDRHLESPITIVIRPDARKLDHVPLALAGNPGAFPDEENFLALLWGHIQVQMENHRVSSPALSLTPQIHAELLRAAGHRVKG